jgi:Uma2 family endonuclease
MNQAPFTSKRWRRVEYERLVDIGVFEHEPLELIGGQLIVAEPQHSPHAAAVGMVGDTLRASLPPGWIIRVQAPVALDDESVPEPDVAVVRGSHADYRRAHPTRAALIVEVAESSLAFDRAHKGSLYARAGIADYWILNVVDHAVEVYRDPGPDPTAPFGWRYSLVERFRPPATLTLLELPQATVPVAALLP